MAAIDFDTLWNGAFVVLVAGTSLARYVQRPERRARRMLRRLPTSDAALALDGEVCKLVGAVAAAPGVLPRAPISGRPCVYSNVVVEVPGRRWREVLREEGGCDFLLADATGRALVRKVGIIPLLRTSSRSTGVLHPVTDEMLDLLRRHHIDYVRGMRFSERRVLVGDRVAVAGIVRRELATDGASDGTTAGGGAYRDAPRRLVVEAAGRVPTFVCDDHTVMG